MSRPLAALESTPCEQRSAPNSPEEPEIIELDDEDISLLEMDCVPFLACRVLFLPLSSGEALRRVRFLPLPLQMLQR